jgi:hypothetical protein
MDATNRLRAAAAIAVSAMLGMGCGGTADTPDARTDVGGADTRVDPPGDVAIVPDAARGDSGLPDVGPTDSAVPDAGPPTGSCAGARICDDFESYTPGPPRGPWTVGTSMATLAVDETRAFSGRRAVHINTMGGAGTYRRAYMSATGGALFPLPGNVMFGRMMLYLVAAPAGSVHWTNIQGEGPVAGQSYRAMYRYGGQQTGRLMANYETSGVSTDCWDHSTTVIPTGRWTCMEWRYDGPNNRMEFWLDGTQLDDLTVRGRGEGCIANDTMGNWYAPTFDTLRLGWEHYQNTTAMELWIDDVAMDTRRFGCPAMH